MKNKNLSIAHRSRQHEPIRFTHDVTGPKGVRYTIDVLTDGHTWIRVVVPIDPHLYSGKRVKSFMAQPEGDGWRCKEVDGRDEMACSPFFLTCRYEGMREREMMRIEVAPRLEKEWALLCLHLHSKIGKRTAS